MMTPSEVNSLLWKRGLPDVGEWLQRELQHVRYLEGPRRPAETASVGTREAAAG
jgi:hypothetical protein